MKHPMAIVGMVAGLVTLAACSAPAQEDGTLESRISSLEKKLSSVEANLGKLDVVSDRLDELLKEAATNSPAVTGDTQTPVGLADQDAADNEAPADFEPADPARSAVDDEPTVADEPTAADEPTVADESTAADDPVLVNRVRMLEQTIAAIEEKLKKIDDIAERVILLSEADSVATKRERSDLVELSGRATGAEPESSAKPQEGTVVVNNWTGVTHFVAVNGTTYRVVPGRNEIKTQYGALTTQLVEYESARQWEVSQWKDVDGEYQVTLDLKN